METLRLQYKKDALGKPVFARIAFAKDSQPKPIALVFHGGGLMVGSSEIVPKPQINNLASKGFLVVIPNYRLAPQVTAKEVYRDCEEAYDWVVGDLVKLVKESHDLEINPQKVVTMGHSSGGTLAMHMTTVRSVQAVTALYPNMAISDTSTSSHLPTTAPPFGVFPDFIPSEEDWRSINPVDVQLSEASLPAPGAALAPRNKWQMSLLKNGKWPTAIQPDNNFAALDPLTRLTSDWAPTMIIAGQVDDIPGSELALQHRGLAQLKAAGIPAQIVIVPDASHMFDLPPSIGTTDQGPKWQAVVKGIEWLSSNV